MEQLFDSRSYTLTPIADTSDRFTDFMPYAVSLNNQGVVAFQAMMRGDASGVYTGSGGLISTVTDSVTGPLSNIDSHPDINQGGSTCFYASFKSGGRGVVLVRDGTVAFRAELGSERSGIFTGSGRRVIAIAETGDVWSAFHGASPGASFRARCLPVINHGGAVAFRADLKAGGHGVYVGDGASLTPIAETGQFFSGLGPFPIMNDAAAVAFCATLRGGGSGVFVATAGEL
jgi:hypothetical protein